jgi:hypothetical protein
VPPYPGGRPSLKSHARVVSIWQIVARSSWKNLPSVRPRRSPCRVGKGEGTASRRREARRAPCPPKMVQLALMSLVGTAHASLSFVSNALPAPLPTLQEWSGQCCNNAKENRPLFAALGQGVALVPVFSLPPQARGSARRQGAWSGLRQTGPGVRGSRTSPDRRALGVKRHAPRLAARQRGILAFKPLTVVGPGRVVVPGEAARVRPGDGGCVSHPLAGAAPVPRSQDAS